MDEDQIIAVKCALADLIGSINAYDSMDCDSHDWDAHRMSIYRLIDSFPLLNLKEPE